MRCVSKMIASGSNIIEYYAHGSHAPGGIPLKGMNELGTIIIG